MVFFSKDEDVVRVRESPVIFVLALTLVAAFLFALAVNAGDATSRGILFAAGVGMLALTSWFAWMRHFVFDRLDRTLVIRDVGLFRRGQQRHVIGERAFAEVVIQDDDDDGDTFQAVLVNGDDAIPLDDLSSLMRPSARIVMAVNGLLQGAP